MSRIAALVLLLAVAAGAGNANFGFTHRFILARDEPAVVEIRKDYPVTFPKEGMLRFRWTLFANRRLVLLTEYEGFRTQYVLEPRFGHDSVRIFLTGDYKRIDRRPFVLLTLERFDTKRARAHLLAQFHDPQKRLEIRIKKPKK